MSTPISAPSTTHQPSKAMNISLWILQLVLAVMFGMAGLMKATTPIAELAEKMVWPGDIPEALVRFIGISEFLGGIGLVLPALTRIKPRLTALAGAGLALVMALALAFHVFRGEFQMFLPNLVIGALAAFVAWGRFRKAPIRPR